MWSPAEIPISYILCTLYANPAQIWGSNILYPIHYFTWCNVIPSWNSNILYIMYYANPAQIWGSNILYPIHNFTWCNVIPSWSSNILYIMYYADANILYTILCVLWSHSNLRFQYPTCIHNFMNHVIPVEVPISYIIYCNIPLKAIEQTIISPLILIIVTTLCCVITTRFWVVLAI